MVTIFKNIIIVLLSSGALGYEVERSIRTDAFIRLWDLWSITVLTLLIVVYAIKIKKDIERYAKGY